MAGSVNKVIIAGNLVRDPEIRSTQAGLKIVSLTVATNDQWKDRNTGEQKERAEYHRVVIFNERLADVAERFLKKGRKVYLEGALETRKYTDNSGQEKYTTEIVLRAYRGELVLLDSTDRGGEDRDQERAPAARKPAGRPILIPAAAGGPNWDTDLNDAIPF